MPRLRTLALIAGSLAAAVTPSAAYYHYVHYLNSSSPYQVAFEKFDLTALPDKTVTFFVSDSGPISYTPNDSFPSVLAQIRNAAEVWNSVASSDLRVAFGGLQIANTPQSVPAGEVVFDPELPPGVLALTGHTSPTNVLLAAADGSQFVPILESKIHLNINLTQQAGAASAEGYTGPSYSELFFTVLVHEIGHAIGLQHAFTSATMSTAVSRATNRARPLDGDDIAGVSLLYPRGGFPAGYGSISGQVTMNGQAVHMASVVAILPNGSAVSNLTNPDGTYEIDGLPPGNYWVYVHPLPPTADIAAPLGPDGITSIDPSGPFVSTFYNGASDPTQFATVPVPQGASVGNINFSVQPRSVVEVYDVTSYWWTGSSYLQPAFLNANALPQVVAQGAGITDPNNPVETIWALGAASGPLASYGTNVYTDVDVTLLEMFFNYPSPPAAGPEHLLFTLSDDIFVLPWGFQIVQNPPPVVTSVTPNPDGSVTVVGTGFDTSGRVFFDSLPGAFTPNQPVLNCPSSSACSAVSVTPPPGASGQTATITVYNADGQNSTFLQSQSPFTYSYPQSSQPAAAISISALPRGISAMVDITTSTMQFVDGLTSLGFGSGDVAVRHLWVLSPTHAVANVTVSPSALQQETVASLISGFQVYEQPLGFQVTPANPILPAIGLPVTNAFYPVQNSLYPGSIASMYGQNLQAVSSNPTITIAGQSAQVLYTSSTQINFVIPVGLATGPAVMTLQGALPVVLQIDPPPPVIIGVAAATGDPLAGSTAAAPGDTITLTISGVDPAVVSAPGRIAVIEGGVAIPVFSIQKAQDGSGNLLIQFALTASVTGQQVPVTVSLDGDLSMPFYINVAAS
jgi:uncharacterized protein (TIGR03437 family)